ncbi:hypothetical protein BSLG_007973 [Batrachochytrium salamandrivorans]|nr:hypothetical protein BSLG_007973 [Batrachochytrium salamandrivorans]
MSSTFLTAKTESFYELCEPDTLEDPGVVRDNSSQCHVQSEHAPLDTNRRFESSNPSEAYQFKRRFRYGATAMAPSITDPADSVGIRLTVNSAFPKQETSGSHITTLHHLFGEVEQTLDSKDNSVRHKECDLFTRLDFAEILDGVLEKLQQPPYTPIMATQPTTEGQEITLDPGLPASESGIDENASTKLHGDQKANLLDTVKASLNPSIESSHGGLEIKVKIQAQVITELGRRIDRLQKQSIHSIEQNALLIRERDVAVQSRNDLLALLGQANKNMNVQPSTHHSSDDKNATDIHELQFTTHVPSDNACGPIDTPSYTLRPRKVPPDYHIHFVEREYFNQDDIVRSALADFNKRKTINASPNKPEDDPSPASVFDAAQLATHPISKERLVPVKDAPNGSISTCVDRDIVRYTSNMLSIKKRWIPPTTIGVGLKSSANTNEPPNIRKGRPSKISITPYHPKRFDILVQQATHYPAASIKGITTRATELFEADSHSKHLQLLQDRLDSITSLLYECIDVLAEEQRHTRHWKAQCKTLTKRLEDAHVLLDSHQRGSTQSHTKRQVGVGALLPQSRSITTDFVENCDQDQRRLRVLNACGSTCDSKELFDQIASAAIFKQSHQRADCLVKKGERHSSRSTSHPRRVTQDQSKSSKLTSDNKLDPLSQPSYASSLNPVNHMDPIDSGNEEIRTTLLKGHTNEYGGPSLPQMVKPAPLVRALPAKRISIFIPSAK